MAWVTGQVFQDQDFSIVNRTSFAVMERLGITTVASFDVILRCIGMDAHAIKRSTCSGSGIV
jgi:hypothetical protein